MTGPITALKGRCPRPDGVVDGHEPLALLEPVDFMSGGFLLHDQDGNRLGEISSIDRWAQCVSFPVPKGPVTLAICRHCLCVYLHIAAGTIEAAGAR